MADTNPLVLGGTAIGALVVGALTMAVVGIDDDVPTTLENVPAGIVQPMQLGTIPSGAATSTVEPTVEPTGPLTTDVDSPIVQPGERVVSEVNLPAGWMPIGEFTLTGDAVGCFKIVASQMIGRTLKVMAKNACDAPLRFTATFQYSKAP